MANRALVIGVGTYGVGSGLSSHKTIIASARRYGEILSQPSFMGPDGCRVLTESEVAGRDVVLKAVERAAKETGPGDRLVVVYVGHGRRWRDAGNGEVHFATASSVERTDWTWVSGANLYDIMRKAKAGLKVLIADCCYSDFLSALGDSDDASAQLGVLGEEHKGTCVLTAVNGEPPAGHEAWAEGCSHLPGGLSGCTTFSGHLLALLENATDREVARFTLGGLRDQLLTEMRSCRTPHHPIPQMLLNRATDSTPIFPDPLARGEGKVAPSPPDRDKWVQTLLSDRDMLPELMRDKRMAGDVAARLLELQGNGHSSLRQAIEKSAVLEYTAEAFFRYLSRANAGGVSTGSESDREPVVQETWNSANLQWVTYVEPGKFVQCLRVMREGRDGAPPMPTPTMLAMRDFAIHRPVHDLLQLAAHATGHDDDAGHDDALQVLATAALRRTPEEAAELVVEHLRTGGGAGAAGAPDIAFGADQLIRSVLNDIAGQRTALDIADFLRACKARVSQGKTAADWVVTYTIGRFTSADSGRTQKDKARLYVVLHEMRYTEEADLVMHGTVSELDPGERRPLADPSRTVEFAGALRTLSPTQPLLVDWLAGHLQDEEFSTYRRLVAQLLHSDPRGRDQLVARVMGLDAHDVVPIFRLLCGEEAAPRVFGEIQRLTAALLDTVTLAALVGRWAKDSVLRSRTQGFLGDIVACGSGGGPRTRKELEHLVRDLHRVDAGHEWVQTLWREAAAGVVGRTGDDLVWLLKRIKGTGHRRAAEQKIALGLAEALLSGTEPPERFVEYLKALDGADDYDPKTAAFLACRELADPQGAARPHRAPVGVLARTALLLAEARLVNKAVDVLERYMEDEHHTTTDDMCALVCRLTADGFPADKLKALLQNTLGRWSDAGRRGSAVAALQKALQERGDADDVLNVVTALR